MVPLPVICIAPVLTRAAAVTVSAAPMFAWPMYSALLFVLALVSVPLIVRLLPPSPPMNGESSQTTPEPVMPRSPVTLAEPPDVS